MLTNKRWFIQLRETPVAGYQVYSEHYLVLVASTPDGRLAQASDPIGPAILFDAPKFWTCLAFYAEALEKATEFLYESEARDAH